MGIRRAGWSSPAIPPLPCWAMLCWMSSISALTSEFVRARCRTWRAWLTFDLLISQRGLSGSHHMPTTRPMEGNAARPNM